MVLLVAIGAGCAAGPRSFEPPRGAPRPLPDDSILVGGIAYVAARGEGAWTGRGVLDAVDVRTGELRWRNVEAWKPLAVADGVVYAWSRDDSGRPSVFAIGATDGATIDRFEPIGLPSWAHRWAELVVRARVGARALLVSWAVERVDGGCAPNGACDPIKIRRAGGSVEVRRSDRRVVAREAGDPAQLLDDREPRRLGPPIGHDDVNPPDVAVVRIRAGDRVVKLTFQQQRPSVRAWLEIDGRRVDLTPNLYEARMTLDGTHLAVASGEGFVLYSLIDGSTLVPAESPPWSDLAVWSDLIFFTRRGDHVSAEETRRWLGAFDAATGRLVWEHEIAPELHDLSASRGGVGALIGAVAGD